MVVESVAEERYDEMLFLARKYRNAIEEKPGCKPVEWCTVSETKSGQHQSEIPACCC